MTEAVYAERLESFETDVVPAPMVDVAVMEVNSMPPWDNPPPCHCVCVGYSLTLGSVQEGRGALEAINKEMGLAFDEWDLDVGPLPPDPKRI